MFRHRPYAAVLVLALLATFSTPLELSAANPATTQAVVDPQFFNAAAVDRDDYVAKAMEKGTDVNAVDSIGRTALAVACDNDSIRTARLLIEKGADVNRAYEQPPEETMLLPTARLENITSIYLAARDSRAELVKLLLEHHADPKAAVIRRGVLYQTFETPLAMAAGSGNLEKVKLLVAAGAEVVITRKAPLTRHVQPMDRAIDSGSVDVAQFLADKGAPVKAEHLLSAVKSGDAPMVSFCISRRADLFQTNSDGSNLLDTAINEKQSKLDEKEAAKFDGVIKVLRDAGLNETTKP